jgi:SAM-dependent methyltransferase
LTGERFKREDVRSYDRAAEVFDRLSATYSTPFADALIGVAEIAPGGRVLDLGAGTGVLAKRLIAAGVRSTAADLSEGMLRLASRHSPAIRMDAEAFAIQPGSLDAVVSLFAVMHFPAPGDVLRACLDALKPGGVLAFAFGAPPPWPKAISHIPRALLDRAMTRTGRMLTAPLALDARIPKPSEAYETPLARQVGAAVNDLVRFTRESGFSALQTGWTGRRFEIRSAEEFWDVQAVFSSRARKGLAALAAAEHRRVREAFLRDAHRVLDLGGSLIYPVGAAWIRATKPFE